MIDALRFSGYRSFRDEQTVPLTRLSLIYGENNAGKSALARLLPWLKASRAVDSLGFDTNAGVWGGAGWRDLIWRGPAGPEVDEDVDLLIGLTLHGGARWTWRSRWRDTKSRVSLEHVEFENVGIAPVKAQAHGLGTALNFDGILPRPGASSIPDDALRRLQQELAEVTWLGARRVGPKRGGSPRGASGRIYGDGAEADGLVLASKSLRERVSRWYEQHLERRLDVEALGSDMERLVLQGPSSDSAFPDTGEGVQRAFSVVVALEQLREAGGVLVVEEPESNLHPRLQQALAELAVDVLRAQSEAQLVWETHSEVLLQCAYEAAAKGLGGGVSILWVEPDEDGASRVIPAELESDGTPKTDRMKLAFETMGVLRRRVQAARQEARARPA